MNAAKGIPEIAGETFAALIIIALCAAVFGGIGWLVAAIAAIPGFMVTIGTMIGAIIGIRLIRKAVESV